MGGRGGGAFALPPCLTLATALAERKCAVTCACLSFDDFTLGFKRSLTHQRKVSRTDRTWLAFNSPRVVVLRRRGGVENPIPSSRFSKSVSKSVSEFSELFSIQGHHFGPALKLKILFTVCLELEI